MNNILLISPEPWNGNSVSKHHYASELARQGHRVFFLNPPDHSLNRIQASQPFADHNLFIVKSNIVAKGLRFMPSILRTWFEKRWLHKLEQMLDIAIDTVWLFENSRFADMRFAGDRLKIYHQVDLNQNFQPELAAKTADLCLSNTDHICSVLQKNASRLEKIQHGYCAPKNLSMLTQEQLDRFNRYKQNAVYIGNLDIPYLDDDLVSQLVCSQPNVGFHFVGGYSDGNSLRLKIRDKENTFWWNSVEFSLIPSILFKADVCLLVYKSGEFREQLANPHKLMEYFASGKVCVASYTDEYKDKTHLLEMVGNAANYLAVFNQVVNNLDLYNSIEKQQVRVDYAHSNTYEHQVAKIKSLIRSLGRKSVATK